MNAFQDISVNGILGQVLLVDLLCYTLYIYPVSFENLEKGYKVPNGERLYLQVCVEVLGGSILLH